MANGPSVADYCRASTRVTGMDIERLRKMSVDGTQDACPRRVLMTFGLLAANPASGEVQESTRLEAEAFRSLDGLVH